MRLVRAYLQCNPVSPHVNFSKEESYGNPWEIEEKYGVEIPSDDIPIYFDLDDFKKQEED